ncbi:MAG: hypothetical protein U0744_13670 [Gemmataceae bacterium]
MDLDQYCTDLGRQAREASRKLATAIGKNKNRWLELAANALESRAAEIQEANAKDIAEAPRYGLTPAAIDRLTLTPARIKSAAQGLREIIALPDPIGRVLSSVVRPNGLRIDKVGVPLWRRVFIYESRPNVTVDAAGLCVKSGNAISGGGKEDSLEPLPSPHPAGLPRPSRPAAACGSARLDHGSRSRRQAAPP